jgi:hypothetical protein
MLPNGSNVASEKGREGLAFSLAMSKLYTYKSTLLGKGYGMNYVWVQLVNILSANSWVHTLPISLFEYE